MEVRDIYPHEWPEAIQLKMACWSEELNGEAPNRLVFEEELAFITHWLATASEHNDQRVIQGIFDSERLIGFAGASFAETSDHSNAVEINYLFVNPEYRNQGLSYLLMHAVLAPFKGTSCEKVIVYNLHHSPSNAFYIKIGATKLREDIQGEDHLLVDVFIIDFHRLLSLIESRRIHV